jgi:hypothetical protein
MNQTFSWVLSYKEFVSIFLLIPDIPFIRDKTFEVLIGIGAISMSSVSFSFPSP